MALYANNCLFAKGVCFCFVAPRGCSPDAASLLGRVQQYTPSLRLASYVAPHLRDFAKRRMFSLRCAPRRRPAPPRQNHRIYTVTNHILYRKPMRFAMDFSTFFIIFRQFVHNAPPAARFALRVTPTDCRTPAAKKKPPGSPAAQRYPWIGCAVTRPFRTRPRS